MIGLEPERCTACKRVIEVSATRWVCRVAGRPHCFDCARGACARCATLHPPGQDGTWAFMNGRIHCLACAQDAMAERHMGCHLACADCGTRIPSANGYGMANGKFYCAEHMDAGIAKAPPGAGYHKVSYGHAR